MDFYNFPLPKPQDWFARFKIETTDLLNPINHGEQKMNLEKLVPTGYDLEKSGTNGNIIAVY